MKSAVMIPQAMKMEMFGMTIPERNLPKVWSFCFMILSSFFLCE
jgi:predicted transporter